MSRSAMKNYAMIVCLSAPLFFGNSAAAQCMGKSVDWLWNGTFKVLSIKKNPITTNELWKVTGGNRTFEGCVLNLQTLNTHEQREKKDKPVDVYVIGKPCDSKVGETIEATLGRNCCDVIGSTETYENQACALNAMRLLEQRFRNPKSGTIQRLLGGYNFEKSREIEIKTYEKNWELYNKGIKSKDRNFCDAIVDDGRLRDSCVSESEHGEELVPK